jgi:hypothetical protein
MTGPNEVPIEVRTSTGRAVVSVVAVVIGGGSSNDVDRLVLRSVEDAQEDAYAVFERHGGPNQTWWKVTDDLTAAQLRDWPNHRRRPAHPAPPFQQWLDHVASAADREGG